MPDEQSLRIERRIGLSPSHRGCRCPLSWIQVVEPVPDASNNDGDRYRDNTLGFSVRYNTVIATSEDEKWQRDIEDLGEGGGIASYELLVESHPRWFKKSVNWAMWQAGMRFTDNPFPDGHALAVQEPLPGLESPPLAMPRNPERRPEWIDVGGPAV